MKRKNYAAFSLAFSLLVAMAQLAAPLSAAEKKSPKNAPAADDLFAQSAVFQIDVDIPDEGIAALRCLFEADSATFEGQHMRFRAVQLAPKPRQQPFPIYVNAHGGPGLDRMFVVSIALDLGGGDPGEAAGQLLAFDSVAVGRPAPRVRL